MEVVERFKAVSRLPLVSLFYRGHTLQRGCVLSHGASPCPPNGCALPPRNRHRCFHVRTCRDPPSCVVYSSLARESQRKQNAHLFPLRDPAVPAACAPHGQAVPAATEPPSPPRDADGTGPTLSYPTATAGRRCHAIVHPILPPPCPPAPPAQDKCSAPR